MNSPESIADRDEQKICVSCGICCDGTLFSHAVLRPGERGHLPEKIEQNSYSENENDYFRLPCLYFAGKCTIYDRARADVCGSYRCRLLKDFSDKNVVLDDALETVRRAVDLRKEILKEYFNISGKRSYIHFRQILVELGNVMKSVNVEEPVSIEYEMLLVKCNIFEALLIKHFRSAEDFEKMIMK